MKKLKLISLVLLTFFGLNSMTYAKELEAKHIYSVHYWPSHKYPLPSNDIIITNDNKVILNDFDGGDYKDGVFVKNKDFGVYAIPIDEKTLDKVNRLNLLLTEISRGNEQIKEQGQDRFSYVLQADNQEKQITGDFLFDVEGSIIELPKDISEEEKKFIRDRNLIRDAWRSLKKLIASPKREKISNLTTDLSATPTHHGLKISVTFINEGSEGISIGAPLYWKEMDPQNSKAFDQWFKVLFTGIYQDTSWSAYIDLLPKYFQNNSLNESDLKMSAFPILPNQHRTLDFIVPYNEIKFYSFKDEKEMTPYTGNRNDQGDIFFDHVGIKPIWYLQVYMSIFTDHVYMEEDIKTLKDWENINSD